MNRAKSCRESHEPHPIADRGKHDLRWLSRSNLAIVATTIAWTGAIGLLTVWYLTNQRANYSEMARNYARAAHEKDLIYRRWNASHGGVYTLVTEKNLPNPYLVANEREVVTPSGRVLTLVNPAYMTRQVHELAENTHAIDAHITSLQPLNPENTPDTWEAQALERFADGTAEVNEIFDEDGEPIVRLMRPLLVEPSCLKCHGDQGYHLGDVRGGISVSVPVGEVKAGLAEGAQLSEQTAESLSQIIKAAEGTAAKIAEIAAATVEQATNAEEVSKAIQIVAQATEQAAAGSEEMASSSEELGAQSTTLRELVTQFQVS